MEARLSDLQAAATATAWLVLPQARSAAKAFFSADDGDADGSKERGGKRRSNTIIDIEPDPEVKQGYDDLDDELKRFDEDLRRRRR